jgi:hypothetical protein
VATTPTASQVPASCWPYDFRCTLPTRPKAVLLTECRELGTNANVSAYGVDWDYVIKSGQPHIRIRNVLGLDPGLRYQMTFLVVWR